MQKYFKYIIIGIFSIGLFACEEMTSTYEEFVVPGGLKYPGQVKNTVYFSGENRAKIEAEAPIDPSVVEARVFWNYYQDSISVNINSDDEQFVAELNNLPENNYAFVIHTYDSEGNVSVPLELFGATYGNSYQSRLTNRTLEDAVLMEGLLTLNFGNADISNGAFATEVMYTDTLEETVSQIVDVSVTTEIIDDIANGNFSYRTLFIPDSLCLDTFYSEINSLSLKSYLNNSGWSIAAFSTNHSKTANQVSNIIDGDASTRWHSHVGNSSYPHWAVIDLGEVKTVTEIEVYRDNGDERAADKIQLLISIDNVEWTDLGTFDFDRFRDGAQSYPLDTPQQARYVKYVGLESGAPDDQHVLGEIKIYGN